uniref:Uncharacterized protein n=1 Tax=Parascaris univalens TaxID=6257 RepID=A0A914ZME1_PARUN
QSSMNSVCSSALPARYWWAITETAHPTVLFGKTSTLVQTVWNPLLPSTVTHPLFILCIDLERGTI